MVAEEGVEVGAVDVDFAANLGEGDETLVSVVLPCLWGDSEKTSCFFGFKPVLAGVTAAILFDHVGETVEFLMQ